MAPALFAWLRDLSFVEHGPQGLFSHDLAREVIDADSAGATRISVATRAGTKPHGAPAEEHDPACAAWTMRAQVRSARSGVAFAVLHERGYVFGGEQPSGTFRENEEYDPAN